MIGSIVLGILLGIAVVISFKVLDVYLGLADPVCLKCGKREPWPTFDGVCFECGMQIDEEDAQ